ncbi:membrane protein [Desulfomarina profundi]|uniref:Membrane protein n=1 Tax=Desulfomarina profundi TaxID=2772557 RepID=A0A8D5FIE7_9BACT|nr:YitT family protein [Desulfomarina profundi]BCL61186.1 membrane protein [Desulfomarina profundi]
MENSIKSILWNLLLLATGSLLFATGANAILVHHKFIIGGLYGTSLLIFYKTGLLSPGIWFFLLNIPLLVIGWIFMSRRFFFYSLFGIVCLTLFSQFLILNFDIHNQLYAAVAGGVICGAGTGIILRSRGSGGGLDIVAIILNQKYNFGVGKFYMIYNALLFSFVLTQYEPDLVIASMIVTFILSIALEQVLALFNQRKIVYIISESQNPIAKMITEELHQGATLINAKGAFSGNDKQLVMTITNNLQLKRLEEKIFTIDPNALFIVENSFNVIGSSFGKRKIY